MFKGKILSIYLPELCLPIFSYEHIKYFLKKLGEYNFTGPNDIELIKNRLISLKNQINPTWTSYKFMNFLYFTFPNVRTKSKDEIDDETPEMCVDDFIFIDNKNERYTANEGNAIKYNESTGYKPDYKKLYKLKEQIGKSGENAVFEFEKKRLQTTGFAEKVEWVSRNDDSLGYDIKSFDDLGNEKHIEVKTTNNASENDLTFYLTDNELDKLNNEQQYEIYYVFGIKTKKPKIRRVNKKQLLEFLKPVLYKISCKIMLGHT